MTEYTGHPTEEAYAEAVGELIQHQRALHYESARRPEFKIAAITNLREAGYGVTDAKDLIQSDPDYAKHKAREAECAWAVLRAEALVEVRKVQMWRSVSSVAA